MKTFVALSGGVDSGVSATLLKERGDEVVGIFMRHRYQRTLSLEETREVLSKYEAKERLEIWRAEPNGTYCKLDWSIENPPFLLPVDSGSALEIASFLNLKLLIFDVDSPFEQIVDYFTSEYYAASTPNPCALCNKTIKFGVLWDFAQQMGAQRFATGHYVRKVTTAEWLDRTTEVNRQVDEYFGFQDVDEYSSVPDWLTRDKEVVCFTRSYSHKDQSYFLYAVPPSAIGIVEFPVGSFTKPKTREIAKSRGLPVATKKDSQEICFVPDGGRLEFIQEVRRANPERWSYLPDDSSGAFVSLDGKEIGRHGGYEKYTVGQRKGLGMGFGERVFVQRINPETRDVTLGPYEALATNLIKAVDSNWHADAPRDSEFRCEIKIRYRNETCFASVRINSDGSMLVKPDKPRYAVAPGQSLVCYWRDRLLGGGRIVE